MFSLFWFWGSYTHHYRMGLLGHPAADTKQQTPSGVSVHSLGSCFHSFKKTVKLLIHFCHQQKELIIWGDSC